jgi:multidrug transporter EmrE-like cation transporter
MFFNRRQQLNMLPVFLGNYFVASLYSFGSMQGNIGYPGTFDIWFGVICGALFLLNFWVYQRCIVFNGLSLSVGVMRIAMIVPVLLAVAVFNDSLSVWNGIGIALGLAAFSMKGNPKEMHNLLWLSLLFIVSGLTDASLKIYKELGSGAETVFIYIIFSSAFVFTLIAIILAKIPLTYRSIFLGCLLGLPNQFSTLFFLKGLSTVPASIAYPVVAVSIVIFSIISDLVFWGKRVHWKDALLWLMLVISLFLLNS